MKLTEAVEWFDKIAQRQVRRRSTGGERMDGSPYTEYDHEESVRWITTAASAIKNVFPAGHAVVRQWDAIFQPIPMVAHWNLDQVVDGARAVFESAREQLKEGRLARLVDTIRSESVGELLDQADALLASSYFAAATVIAGGALESFLKHLCERNALTWKGDGSISAYDDALAQARNAGNEVISPTESKVVKSWGGMRNDAAHTPGQFKAGRDDVRRMVEGVRGFVAKHT